MDTKMNELEKFVKTIESIANKFNIKADDIKCVIFDNWNRENPIFIEHLQQLRKEFPQLNAMPSLWTRSYFVSTAGNVSSETIKWYVNTQKTRP